MHRLEEFLSTLSASLKVRLRGLRLKDFRLCESVANSGGLGRPMQPSKRRWLSNISDIYQLIGAVPGERVQRLTGHVPPV